MTRYVGFWSVDGGYAYEGCSAATHNQALRLTRRLFSGQGYRNLPEETGRTGKLQLVRPDGVRAVIWIVPVP